MFWRTGRALPLVIAAGACGLAVLTLLTIGRLYGVRIIAAAGVAAVIWGWGIAQYPVLLPGTPVTLTNAGAPHATLAAIIWLAVAAVLTVGPSYALLLTLQGRQVLRASQTQGTGPVSPGTPTSPAGDHPDSVANHRLGRPAAAGPPLRVSPPSPAAETADPRTGRPAPRRRARWSANRRTPAYAGPQRRTAKSAAAGQSVSPSELPRLPGPGHRVQAGGSALGGAFVEEIRNCVGHGHVRQA